MNEIFAIPSTTENYNRLSITGPDFEGEYLVEVYGEMVLLDLTQLTTLGAAIQQELVDRKAREDGVFAAAVAQAASCG